MREERSRQSREWGPQDGSAPQWMDYRYAQYSLVCHRGALVVALFAFLIRGPRQSEWPRAQGIVQDTRIVADHGVATKWGGQLTWKAEYKVAYFVGTREYAVWADSGVQGESEAAVRLAVPQSRRRFCQVQYNPQRPEVSVPDCRSQPSETQ